jgi:DNA uptake protein ComE-like DNA-binding protein
LSPPYAPRNGALETVEELLLVRGITPDLLFGRDINRNGMVDSHEQGAPVAVETDDPHAMDRGWSAYLTLFSQERNASPTGEKRVWLNQEDMETLHSELLSAFSGNREWANFIVAYRQNGPFTGDDDDAVGADSGELDLAKPGRFQLNQVLDLIGPPTRVKFEGDDKASVLKSPFPNEFIVMGAYMPILMDRVSVNQDPMIPGRININQASRVVLSGIPGMDAEIVNQIISLRDAEYDEEKPNRRHETWLLIEAVVTLDQMRALMPFVTAGGDVYRTQAVGYFDGGQAASRAEVIIDATAAMPRIVSWRDISHLGRGYALETLGIEAVEE